MNHNSRDIDALLAPFRALGAGENVATTVDGERLIWGVQCQGTAVDDSYVSLFLDMPELRALGLSNTAITNAALPTLAKMPCLESLDLDGTGIDDAGLTPLVTFPHLEFLHLARTRVTRIGILSLKKMLPMCEIVTDYD